MTSLDLLFQTLPTWVKVIDRRKNEVDIDATPPPPGGQSARNFHLRIGISERGGACIMEQPGRRQFPAFCLERHINADSSFCLQLDSEAPIADNDAAISWWSSLGTFLFNQVYAEQRGLWPLESGLSHADAAREQLAMEKLATPLNWRDDVLRAIFRGTGWLAESLPRVSKTGDRVLNARSPCPRGCTRKHKLLRKRSCDVDACLPGCRKQHKPVLRSDCPNRRVIESLVMHEHRRRRIEAQIFDILVQEGHKCCGTMKFCPLRK